MKKIVEKKTRKKVKAVSTKKKMVQPSGLAMYNIKGDTVSTVTVPAILLDIEVKPQMISQYVKVYLANKRQGNASTKTRSEVIGSTRKIYKQKGTGKARHGDIKAPIFVGGGIAGGPLPRDYSLSMNKKQKSNVFKQALALRIKENALAIMDDSCQEIEPKTRILVEFLKTINLLNKKTLIVLPQMKKSNFIQAVRNIKTVSLVSAQSLNAFELLKYTHLLFLKGAWEIIVTRFSTKKS